MISFYRILAIVILPFLFTQHERTVSSDSEHVSKVYITAGGVYKRNTGKNYSSICIPYTLFKPYQYLTVKANAEYASRVHVLKSEPEAQNEKVKYSDYYGESFVVAKGMKLDIAIPADARYIVILNSTDGHRNTPDAISLNTAEDLCHHRVGTRTKAATRGQIMGSHRFMHWNIGNFSNGEFPYSAITDKNYAVRLKGYNDFINKYCPDCHYLLNEYNEVFATIKGKPVSTSSVLFGNRVTYKDFPRSSSSGYNKLAAFWKEGLKSYEYGVFNSLKGVKNSRGTYEYGVGYCLSHYTIGGASLCVMSLHAPNRIKSRDCNALYKEILKICSGYDNCILVGDFNRTAPAHFSVLTNAGFKILNDGSVTHPASGQILDWVLYRCNTVTVSDFKVYKEAVDSKGHLLSDHLPLSFTVTKGKPTKH